jgi:hypothetical protein
MLGRSGASILNIAHDVRLPPQCVGAGLLANPVCQARARSDVLTPSRASALLQSIQATFEMCGVHKSVGAGLLANPVRQAGTRSDVLTP